MGNDQRLRVAETGTFAGYVPGVTVPHRRNQGGRAPRPILLGLVVWACSSLFCPNGPSASHRAWRVSHHTPDGHGFGMFLAVQVVLFVTSVDSLAKRLHSFKPATEIRRSLTRCSRCGQSVRGRLAN